jgi:hypothetical protein
MPPDGGDLAVSSGPSDTRPEGSPPLVEKLVTVINLSDDDSPPDRRPAGHQQQSRKRSKSRACLLWSCSQRVLGNGWLQQLGTSHLPTSPQGPGQLNIV